MEADKPLDLESLGFSIPTIARLRASGIHTVADFVAQEESVTASLVIKAVAPQAVPDPAHKRTIEELPISSRIRNCLHNANLATVPDLLARTARQIKNRSFGYKSFAQLFMCLIDEGYSEKDGILLSKESAARLLMRSEVYSELVRFDTKSGLSKEFMTWFNRMIEGSERNTTNQPNRKVFIKPFKI
jgi:hypothetical protein